MRKLNKKKKVIALMALTFMFTITGCKNIGTIDGKTGSPVTEIDNDDTIAKGDEGSGSKNEDTSIIYDKEDIIMKAEKETYSNKVEEITITIENNSPYEYYYGEEFSLEQQVDGEWILVSPKEEIFVIDIANILESNGTNTFVSPLGYYDELSDGHYRIVKRMVKANTNEDEATGQTERFLLTAEFNISSEVGETSRLAPVYVSVDKEIYSDNDDVIKYTIVNNTDETKNVVLAPRLEKEVGDGWEGVKCEAGFCGTPDSLKDKIDGEIKLEWFPTISDGVYRLSFDVEENGRETTLISDMFTFMKESNTPSVTAEEEPILVELDDTVNQKPSNYKIVNNFDGVTMSVNKESLSANGLTIMFQNKSDKKLMYGDKFVLEIKIDGQWYEVPVVINGDYGFNDIGYEVPSGQDKEWEVDWKWLYGSLNEGEYRIVKEVSDFRKTRDYNIYYLTGEFTLSN